MSASESDDESLSDDSGFEESGEGKQDGGGAVSCLQLYGGAWLW